MVQRLHHYPEYNVNLNDFIEPGDAKLSPFEKEWGADVSDAFARRKAANQIYASNRGLVITEPKKKS